jgi:hypothetical protein
MQMDGEPESAIGGGLERMRRPRRQKQVVSGPEHDGFTGDVQFRLAANEEYPLILRLHVLRRSDASGAHDALDHEISMRKHNIRAFTRGGRRAVCEEIARLPVSEGLQAGRPPMDGDADGT